MNLLQTMWSISRRKSLLNCPRQYVMRYSRSQEKWKYSNNLVELSLTDLMIRSSRKLMLERLEDHKNGIEWSSRMVQLKLKLGLKVEMNLERYEQVKRKESRYLNDLINSAKNKIDSLWNTEIFKRIISSEIRQWSVMDRKKFFSDGHIDIFCSPDICYKIQNKWNLVRIDFQGERKNASSELEGMAMVNWAKRNNFLPLVTEQYIVHTLKYIGGFWIHEKYFPSEEKLQQSKQLLEKDVNAMNNLVNKMGPLMDLSQIPLSNSQSNCNKCSFKQLCPAKDGLEQSKIEQNSIEYNSVKIRFESK